MPLTSSHEPLSYIFLVKFVTEVERLAVVVQLQHVLQVFHNDEAETFEQRLLISCRQIETQFINHTLKLCIHSFSLVR